MREEAPADYLKRMGEAGDGPHDIATAALMLSAFDHPDRKLAPYRSHLAELAGAARSELEFARDAEIAARALAAVVAGRFGYEGDRANYEEPENADFIFVIERRRGLPVALGIVYMHAARAAGLRAHGLAAPGHFLLMIESAGAEAVVDPFNGGVVIDAESLAAPPMFTDLDLPGIAQALDPVSDTDVLLRLLNNIKTRALEAADAARAIEIVRRMTLIAPGRAAPWLELGRLEESAGSLGAARAAYESALARAKRAGGEGTEAALALLALKRRLN